MYQKAESDGWNRIDAYNILANPFTTIASAGGAGPPGAVHADPGADGRQLLPRRRGRELQLRQHAADLDHLLRLSRHPGRARRGSAHLEHHRRLDRPARERLHARLAAGRRHRGPGLDAGSAHVRRQRPPPVGRRRLLRLHAEALCAEPQRHRIHRAQRHSQPGASRRQRRALLLEPDLQDAPVRVLRRGQLLSVSRGHRLRRPALLQLGGRQAADLRRHLRQRQQRQLSWSRPSAPRRRTGSRRGSPRPSRPALRRTSARSSPRGSGWAASTTR